jgi:hypothetical protein
VNSPEEIRADSSARLFSSINCSTVFTSLSTESGPLPFEEEHVIIDKPIFPAKPTKLINKTKEFKAKEAPRLKLFFSGRTQRLKL